MAVNSAANGSVAAPATTTTAVVDKSAAADVNQIFIAPEVICQYAVLDMAGVGSSSHVYKAVSPTSAFSSPIRNIAMKRYQKAKEPEAKEEIEVLCTMKGSPYVVDYYGAFNFNGELVLAMELLGPSLSHHSLLSDTNTQYSYDEKHIQSLYTSWAKIAKQLLCSVVSLNARGYIHADLTPDHILFDPGHKRKIKLVDFARALKIRDLCKFGGRSGCADMFANVQPDICYRAPEVLLGDPSFDGKIDIWSIGVILLELYINNIFSQQRHDWSLLSPSLSRKDAINTLVSSFGSIEGYPIPDESLKLWEPGMILKAKENTPPSVLSLLVSDKVGVKNGAIVFLLSLLSLDRKRRPTASEALRHPFLIRQLLGDWAKHITPSVRRRSESNGN